MTRVTTLSGAVGSIVGQIAGNALGVQNGFSWSAVATGALTSGLGATGAFGVIIQMPSAQVITRSVVSQGLNIVTGQQKGFSWTSVAVSAVASQASSSLTSRMNLTNVGANIGDDLIRAGTGALVSATTQRVIQGGKVNWSAVAADTLSGFVQNRVNSNPEPTLAEKYKLSLARKDDQRFLSNMQAMQSGATVSDTERYWSSGFGMKQLGASPEDIALNLDYQKQQGLYPDLSAAEYRAQYAQTSPINSDSIQLTIAQVPVTDKSVVYSSALGSGNLDDIAIGAGRLVRNVADVIEKRPWLKYSIEALDIAVAPAAYAARAAIDGTYIGNKIQAGKEYLFNKATSLFTNTGYDNENAINGGTGIFAVLGMGASGAKGVLGDVKNLVQVVKNKLDGLARERLTKIELQQQYPNASIQAERALRSADGTRAIDSLTGTGRNIDHVVIQDGKVIDSVETTSLTANKDAQILKKNRIRNNGGSCIRDKTTGQLINLDNIQTRHIRRE